METQTSPRLEKINAMLADSPEDTFLRYGLAMELEKLGRHGESLSHLRSLMADSTPYVPAFFMAAQHVVKQGQVSDARQFLREGIEEARRQGNAHAAGEMSEMLASLGELGE